MSSLTAPSNYAYPNARVMAMRGLLLKETDIKALICAKDILGYTALLEHTPYRENFSKLEKVDIDNIENALFIHLVDTSKRILDMVPEKAMQFFAERFKKYEIELLKIIINHSDRANMDFSGYYPLLSRNTKRVITQIIESKNIADIAEVLKGTEYGRFIAEVPVSGEQVLPLITAFDRYYLENLWNCTGNLSKIDRKMTRIVVGTEIDITNIMTILRSMKLNYEAEGFLIPLTYRLGDLKGILGLSNIADVVSKLSDTPYGNVLEKSLSRYEEKDSLLYFELNLKNYLIRECRGLFAGYPFHVGIPLGFIVQKEMEVGNLRAIAMGIDSKLPQEEIEDMIVM